MTETDLVSVTKQVKETVTSIRQSLECPICLDLLKNPLTTQCLHQFCSECILTFITSTPKPKCPLCKEPVCKRGLAECPRIDSAVSLVKDLENSVLKDVGIADGISVTPPQLLVSSTNGGTPGIKLHSLLHPTPHKPPPLRTKN